MGGGKTQFGARCFISMAMYNANTRYAVFRKNRPSLIRTTYQTFLTVAREFGAIYKENRQEMVWEFPNGSQIWFVEADSSKDPGFNKIKGFELTAAMIDEANEVEEAVFNILMLRINRCNPNNEHSFIYLTCNPDKNWVKTRFYDPWSEGKLQAPYLFIQALAKDNEFLSPIYLQTIEDLPELERKRYGEGNWDYSNDPRQLILFEWIKGNLCDRSNQADGMGIDAARYGDDRTVFGYRNGSQFVNYEIFTKQDTTETAKQAILRMQEKGIGYENVSCDVIGLGAGVVDYMKSQQYPINEFNAAASSYVDPQTKMPQLLNLASLQWEDSLFSFSNLRAQMHWSVREAFRKSEIQIINDNDLIKELTNLRYESKNKVIQIEGKDQIKKRLGFSPDIADALVISYYKQQQEQLIHIEV